MRIQREEGDRYSPRDEDYVAGRTENQKRIALEAKKIRTYLISRPGANTKDIREGTGIEKPGAAITLLLRGGFIRNRFDGLEVVPQ